MNIMFYVSYISILKKDTQRGKDSLFIVVWEMVYRNAKE